MLIITPEIIIGIIIAIVIAVKRTISMMPYNRGVFFFFFSAQRVIFSSGVAVPDLKLYK